MLVTDLVADHAARDAAKPFLQFDSYTLTYRGFAAEVDRLATELDRVGLGVGDRVGLLLPNCPEFVTVLFACMRIGAVAVPLQIMLSEDELQFTLTDSDARAVVTSPFFIEPLGHILPQLRKCDRVLVISDPESSLELPDDFYTLTVARGDAEPEAAETHAPSFPTDPPSTTQPGGLDATAPVVQIYAAGTAGPVKGVVLSHANLLANADQIGAGLELSADDVMYGILPLHHVFGLMVTLIAPLAAGASVVLGMGFSARRFWRTMMRTATTIVAAVPTIYQMLLNLPGLTIAPDDTAHIRAAISGGAPLPPSTKNAFESRFGVPIVEGYGLSEATCAVTLNPIGARRPGSIGKVLPGIEVRIVNRTGAAAPVGEVGELQVSGPNLMAGYYNNPDATAAVLHDGWLATGDLGYRDEDDYYYLVGRKKALIIRGGENIYPGEIEHVLIQHPSVQAVVVVGVPDELYGEEVKAFIVPIEADASAVAEADTDTDMDTVTAAAPTKTELGDYCREHLAEFKIPTYFEFVPTLDALPHLANGSIDEAALAKAPSAHASGPTPDHKLPPPAPDT